jgi:rod shape-determining protein MreC
MFGVLGLRPSFRPLLTAALICTVLYWQAPLRRTALSVLRFPFVIVKATARMLVTLPSLPELSDRNASLQHALIQHNLEVAQLREALRGAVHAQQLLDRSPAAGGLIAALIARSPIPTQHTIWVDRGARDGVTPDSAVLDAFGVAGRVTELQGATSLVMLLTDPESRVAGLIERSRESGLLIGKGRGECELIYLDLDADVEPGDRVVTAGLGGIFPKGLLLGTVKDVTRDELNGAAQATVAPAAHLGRLEEVLVLPPREREPDPALRMREEPP